MTRCHHRPRWHRRHPDLAVWIGVTMLIICLLGACL